MAAIFARVNKLQSNNSDLTFTYVNINQRTRSQRSGAYLINIPAAKPLIIITNELMQLYVGDSLLESGTPHETGYRGKG